MSTRDLAVAFFRWRKFKLAAEPHGTSGCRVEFIVKPPERDEQDEKNQYLGDEGLNVVVIDSRRSLGYNTVLSIKAQLESSRNPIRRTCIVVGKKGYSQSAKEMAEKEGFILMTRGELVSIFESEQVDPHRFVL
jgi:hypothetical protein